MMPSAAPFTNSKSNQTSGGGCGGTGATAGLLPPAQNLKCPRCNSPNTKFCYYNNYSLSQPRYFCKCCRRYWTKGGSLRNVPVGGGCRKSNKTKSKSSSPSSITSSSSSSSTSVVIESLSSMNHSSIASSIESLSCMNQDLHWRLQQQRLQQQMYFGAGEEQRQRQNSTAAAETAWFLDGSFPAMNDDDDGGCGNGDITGVGEWNGIRDWSNDLPQFTLLP